MLLRIDDIEEEDEDEITTEQSKMLNDILSAVSATFLDMTG